MLLHSLLSASLGSARVVRWAGSQLAGSVTTNSAVGTTANGTGSNGRTPNGDLPRASRHLIGEYAVDAQRRQQDAAGRKSGAAW